MKEIWQISLLNTFRFNWYYFAKKGKLKTFFKFPCIVSRNVRLKTLKGEVAIEDEYCGVVKIGFGNVAIFDNERAVWMNRGTIRFKGKARIGRGTRIANTGNLIIGDNLEITAKSEFVCKEEIEIGKDCLISWDVLIMDSDFHKIYSPIGEWINPNKRIIIGDHVWIGCRTTILKGAIIDNNTVVAANSLITGNNKGNSIIGTSRIIRENISWER